MLQTTRLQLVPWQTEDVQRFYAITKNPKVFLAIGCEAVASLEEARTLLAEEYRRPEEYKIVLRSTGQIIGSIGLRFGPNACSECNEEPEVGYWLAQEHWGRGYASEALNAVLRHAAQDLHCRALWACYFVGNTRSEKVIRKAGFQYVRTNPAGDTRLGFSLPEVECRLSLEGFPLELKPLSPADEAGMLEILTNELVKQTYMLPDFAKKEDAIPLFRRLLNLSHDSTHFVRGMYAGGALVGFLNDVEIANGTIELGYVVHPSHHGKGYATAALKAAISALFEMGYQEIVCGAFSENPASIRVMQKAGMTQLPKTEELEYRGKLHHCVYYSIRQTR